MSRGVGIVLTAVLAIVLVTLVMMAAVTLDFMRLRMRVGGGLCFVVMMRLLRRGAFIEFV